MLWQKLMISIFLNGHTREECGPASAFHKTSPVFPVLRLLYRTESSMSNNSPVSITDAFWCAVLARNITVAALVAEIYSPYLTWDTGLFENEKRIN